MSCETILAAAVCAAEAHAKQKRKVTGEPYFNHVLRVAEHAAKAGLSEEAIVAALLHDSVEDTKMTYTDLSNRFSRRVTMLVKLLTQWWSDFADPQIKAIEKPKYYSAILKDQDAMAIKLLDRADNLIDMARCLPKAKDWAARYLYRSERDLIAIHRTCNNQYARARYQYSLDLLRKKLLEYGEKPQELF